MGYTGGDLIHLWRVANVHLPRVADVYYDSNRAIAGGTVTPRPSPTPGADDEEPIRDTDAFRNDTTSVSGATSSGTGAAWSAVRDELQALYAHVGSAILKGQDALNRAQDAFVEQDLANSGALQRYLDDPTKHDKNAEDLNPPAPGSDEDPGEPEIPIGYNPDRRQKLDQLS